MGGSPEHCITMLQLPKAMQPKVAASMVTVPTYNFGESYARSIFRVRAILVLSHGSHPLVRFVHLRRLASR